jgi:hypothetical protein
MLGLKRENATEKLKKPIAFFLFLLLSTKPIYANPKRATALERNSPNEILILVFDIWICLGLNKNCFRLYNFLETPTFLNQLKVSSSGKGETLWENFFF